MPHVIIEFAPDAIGPSRLAALVEGVHRAVLTCGLFEPEHIKTRALAAACYRTGSDDRPFIHAQLRIRPGRSPAQKRALSDAVLAALRAADTAAGVVTVEVADMDGDSYAKFSR